MTAFIPTHAQSVPDWIRRAANIINPTLNPDRIQTEYHDGMLLIQIPAEATQ